MKLPRRAWIVALLLCLATLLNYTDRLALGVVSRDIRAEFHLDEQDYAHIVMLFMAAYAVMYAGSGPIVDRLGARAGFALFLAAWSLAQMGHALASGKWTLGLWRAMLGFAEPGNWPAAARAVGEWFPPERRALGVGIFNAGSSMGSMLAMPLVAGITLRAGWRMAFVVTGGLGLILMAVWLLSYRTPAGAPPPGQPSAWRAILSNRGCWTLIVARFFTDPVIYFISFWLPEYLRKERGFDLAMIGKYAWVPFIFGDIGYLFGGWLSGKLIDRGFPLPRARKRVLLLGACCLPPAILAPFAPSGGLAIAATCAATFGHALWISNLLAVPIDLFKPADVGRATGFSGAGGAVGGMLATLGTGYLVAHFSYAPVFLMAGLMHPLAAVIVFRLLPDRCFAPVAATPILQQEEDA